MIGAVLLFAHNLKSLQGRRGTNNFHVKYNMSFTNYKKFQPFSSTVKTVSLKSNQKSNIDRKIFSIQIPMCYVSMIGLCSIHNKSSPPFLSLSMFLACSSILVIFSLMFL